MGCSKCGGKATKRCCLCNQSATKLSPWGHQKICWRCKDKQTALVETRTMMNDRATTLMSGKPWNKTEYLKDKKD